MPEKAEVMGYCKYPGGIHTCIEDRGGVKHCGECWYFTTDHPDMWDFYVSNPDFLEIL